MSECFIGVDPGKKGGLAVLSGSEVRGIRMPERLRDVYNFFLTAALEAKKKGQMATVVMEKVGPMPKQGVTSMFNFGSGYGSLQMAAVASECRLVLVRPQEWKKVVLAGTDKSKGASIRVCENLFPDVGLVPKGCRKPHDGIAEAVLLAEYGRRANL